MIIAKCPLRVSLGGGSTDLISYLKKYKTGMVINFPITLYTYIMITQNFQNKYMVSYSDREEVSHIRNIKNDIVRETLQYFHWDDPINIVFTADIPASKSGLASSTSYIIALVQALLLYNDISYSQYQICKIAHTIEQKINPLTGYQDPYGCGIGGLKKLTFHKDNIHFSMDIEYIDETLLRNYHFYLIDTGIRSHSTKILRSLNVDKIFNLMDNVKKLYAAIETRNDEKFCEVIADGWKVKKNTSTVIMQNENLLTLERELYNIPNVKCIRLCGSGNGGFFLIITIKNIKQKLSNYQFYEINIDSIGVCGWKF